MLDDGRDENQDPQGDDGYAGPDGGAGPMDDHMGLRCAHLAKKEAKTGHRKPYAHQAEACSDPCQKGSLGGEVDSGVLFRIRRHLRLDPG